MKLVNKKTAILAIAASMLLGSCDKFKDFGNTNVDPNRTTTPSTAALLTNVLTGISGRASQQNPGYYCQYFAETQYPTVSLYSLPQFDFDGIYAGALYDLQNIIYQNSTESLKSAQLINGSTNNQIAIARILKAYYMWTITDAWGDCPYKDALQGLKNLTPKFDKQADIYTDLLKELKEANLQFDAGAQVKGDIIFAGDNSKWKKLSNSLRMLISLRMSKRFPNAGQTAANEFAAALADAGGVIDSNADNFTAVYPGGNFRSPWFAAYDGRKDIGESEPFINLLSSLSDKRQSSLVFGSSNIGVPYGRDRNYMNTWTPFSDDTWSRVLGASYRTDNAKVDIVHSAAVYFARAEARERGWTTESTAKALYDEGIRSSFTQWGLNLADANTYLASSSVAYGTNNLTKIATQRFIALYPDGLQGWSEWRRTGVPTLTPALDASNSSKQIVRRFVYGVNDYSTNKVNVQEAAARMSGGDTQDSKVWWDQ